MAENVKEDEIRTTVRNSYAQRAVERGSCCGGGAMDARSKKVGYTEVDLKIVPEGANLGLGCGNPVALASLKEGEVVLDLGAGAGFDCFLAAARVGPTGHVIGVDMTPEMLDRARANASKSAYKNVEFRLGEIEHLPVADNSVDIIISNCVINLSPNKKAVFAEAHRVLKPGGRLMISDIVLQRELPDVIKQSVQAYAGCVAGAEKKDRYLDLIRQAGFKDTKIVDEKVFEVKAFTNDPTVKEMTKGLPFEKLAEAVASVASVKVSAVKK